jgi:hypothetical protein
MERKVTGNKIEFKSVSSPIVSQTSNSKDVYWWGERNDFFQYLIDLYHYSPTHQAIIEGKVLMVSGIVEASFAEVRKKCIRDYLLFGGCALKVIRDIDGKVVDVQYCNYSNFRKLKNKQGIIAYSDEWVNVKGVFKYTNNTKAQYIEHNLFDVANNLKYSIYLIEDLGYSKYYPVPDYIGALQHIELDYRIANYCNNHVRRGFAANTMINMPGAGLTQEERDKIEQMVQEIWGGDERAGSFIINFFKRPDDVASVVKIDQPDVGEVFGKLSEIVMQEIFIAHRVTSPMLFGVRTPGQLGGRNEMIDAASIFKSTYVLPKRNEIDKHFKQLLGEFEVKDFDVITRDITELKGILTVDEIREGLGYKPLNAEQKKDIEEVKTEVMQKLRKKESKKKFEQFEIVSSDDVHTKPTKESEARVLLKYAKQLGEIELQILDWILKDRNIVNDMRLFAGIIGISTSLLNEYIDSLRRNGYIDDNGLTPKGILAVQNKEGYIKKEVRYSYEWAYGFNDKNRKTSREFCIELMKESERRKAEGNLWTRDEIDEISSEVGWDVWTMRGGWYRVKGTEISIPHCRHTWKQHIIISKS